MKIEPKYSNSNANLQHKYITYNNTVGNMVNNRHISKKDNEYYYIHFLGIPFQKIEEEVNELIKNQNLIKSNYELFNSQSHNLIIFGLRTIFDKARLSVIDNKIVNKKNSTNKQLQQALSSYFNPKGFLNNKLYGYNNLKSEIKTFFISPVKNNINGQNIIPSCFILAGPPGIGKKTFTNAVVKELEKHAKFVDFTNFANSEDFQQQLYRQLNLSKQEYLNSGKRTILLIDNGESIISINKNDARILGISLAPEDEKRLEIYGNNADKISLFKALLDNLSKIPENPPLEIDSKAATTLFLTTPYPHLIHPDIIQRKGKATTLNFNILKDNDIINILKFNRKKLNKIVKMLKEQKSNPYYIEALNAISTTSSDTKSSMIKLIKNGSSDKLDLKLNDSDYEVLMKKLNPTKELGAYSNYAYKNIMFKAFEEYLKNNSTNNYFSCLNSVIDSYPRDISPNIYKYYNQISFSNKKHINVESIYALLEQQKMGLLSPKSKSKLDKLINKTNIELNNLVSLEKESILSEQQIKRKLDLIEIQKRFSAENK